MSYKAADGRSREWPADGRARCRAAPDRGCVFRAIELHDALTVSVIRLFVGGSCCRSAFRPRSLLPIPTCRIADTPCRPRTLRSPGKWTSSVSSSSRISRNADALITPLSDEQFTWQPAPDSWSVARCVEHLNVAARLYLPKLDEGIADAIRRGTVRRRPVFLPRASAGSSPRSWSRPRASTSRAPKVLPSAANPPATGSRGRLQGLPGAVRRSTPPGQRAQPGTCQSQFTDVEVAAILAGLGVRADARTRTAPLVAGAQRDPEGGLPPGKCYEQTVMACPADNVSRADHDVCCPTDKSLRGDGGDDVRRGDAVVVEQFVKAAHCAGSPGTA